MPQKCYMLTVHVIQSGESIKDAKNILSGSLGAVLDAEDFDVSPFGIEIHQNSSMLTAKE